MICDAIPNERMKLYDGLTVLERTLRMQADTYFTICYAFNVAKELAAGLK